MSSNNELCKAKNREYKCKQRILDRLRIITETSGDYVFKFNLNSLMKLKFYIK